MEKCVHLERSRETLSRTDSVFEAHGAPRGEESNHRTRERVADWLNRRSKQATGVKQLTCLFLGSCIESCPTSCKQMCCALQNTDMPYHGRLEICLGCWQLLPGIRPQ